MSTSALVSVASAAPVATLPSQKRTFANVSTWTGGELVLESCKTGHAAFPSTTASAASADVSRYSLPKVARVMRMSPKPQGNSLPLPLPLPLDVDDESESLVNEEETPAFITNGTKSKTSATTGQALRYTFLFPLHGDETLNDFRLLVDGVNVVLYTSKRILVDKCAFFRAHFRQTAFDRREHKELQVHASLTQSPRVIEIVLCLMLDADTQAMACEHLNATLLYQVSNLCTAWGFQHGVKMCLDIASSMLETQLAPEIIATFLFFGEAQSKMKMADKMLQNMISRSPTVDVATSGSASVGSNCNSDNNCDSATTSFNVRSSSSSTVEATLERLAESNMLDAAHWCELSMLIVHSAIRMRSDLRSVVLGLLNPFGQRFKNAHQTFPPAFDTLNADVCNAFDASTQ